MKHVLILFTMVLVMAVSAVAQTPAQKDLLTPQEAEKIRDGVSAVLKYIESEQNLDSNAIASGKVNIPDVVDKALDHFGSAVTFVYDNVEKAAPQVWNIMILQQYAKAFSSVLGPILGLLLIWLMYRFLNRHWTPAVDETWNSNWGTKVSAFWWRNSVTKVLPIIFAVFTSWSLFSSIQDATLLLVNPKYYAIRDLLVMLLGSSHGM